MENENNENIDTTGVVDNQNNTIQEKTYSKNDIDNSFNAGYKKAKDEFVKSEDYNNFMNWKKGNAENVKINEDLQNKYNQVLKEKNDLFNSIILSKSNVKEDFKDFVKASVQNNVNDEVDFETALEQFKKEKPQYFGDVIITKVQTAPNLGGSVARPLSTNDIMNKILRGQ